MHKGRRWIVLGRVLALVAAIIAGLAWALSSPVGASPDDDFHQASIWCPVPVESSGCPVRTDATGAVQAVEVPRVVAEAAACFAFHNEISGSCTLHIPSGMTWTDRFNQGEYPGGFYRTMHLFAGPDVQRSVALMRAANVLIAVALLGSLALVAAPGQRRMLGLGLLAPLVPLGIFLSASINPSGWSFVGVATAAAGLLVGADAPSRRRAIAAGALAVVGALLAINARGDAGPYLCVTAAAVGLATLRWNGRWLLTRGPAVVLVGAIGLFSYLTSRQAALISETQQAVVDKPTRLFYHNVLELPNLFTGMFGSWALGWTDNPMPQVVSVSSLAVAILVVVVGVSSLNVGKAAALLLVTAVMVVLPVLLLLRLGASVGSWVQPRYLLPLAPVFLLLLAYDPRRRASIRLSLAQCVLAGTLASVAYTVGLYTTLRRYLTGLDGPLIIGRGVEWWWGSVPGPRVVFVAGTLCFTIVAFTLLLGEGTVIRRVLRRPALADRSGTPAAAVAGSSAGAEAPVRQPTAEADPEPAPAEPARGD